jgi:hypothetical protein
MVVATGDAGLRPAITRAWGPELSEDGDRLVLCVEAPEGSATWQNLAVDGGAVAVMFSLPSTYSSAQLKGTVLDRREPTAADLARAEAHLDAFAGEVELLGLPRDASLRFLDPQLVAVVVGVTERWDQTPGPGAGDRL